jgi:hypothetical protein
MSTVTALARKDHLGGRQSLREAIAAAGEAREQVSAIKDAIERAQRFAWAGRDKLEAATKRVTAAKAEDAEALASALVGGGSTPPQAATQRAREELLAAGDALEAARSAVTRLEADLKDAEDAAKRAAGGVRAIVAAILAPLAEKMRNEAQHLRAEYLKRQHAIDAMAERLDGFTHLDFSVRDEEYRALCASVRQPWLDAIETLKRDADAPLPG